MEQEQIEEGVQTQGVQRGNKRERELGGHVGFSLGIQKAISQPCPTS